MQLTKLYGNGGILEKHEVVVITDKWQLYRSLASLYLWKSLDNASQDKINST